MDTIIQYWTDRIDNERKSNKNNWYAIHEFISTPKGVFELQIKGYNLFLQRFMIGGVHYNCSSKDYSTVKDYKQAINDALSSMF